MADRVTRIKVQVHSVTRTRQNVYKNGQYTTQEVQNIKMGVVTGNDTSEEDKRFFAATPSGNVEFGVVNADAAKPFDLGKAFYVDFTPAE